jgi:hypothetical protein
MQPRSNATWQKLAQKTAMGLLMDCSHLTSCYRTNCTVHGKTNSVFKHNCIGYALAAGAHLKVGTGQAGEGRKYSDSSSCLLVLASQCIQLHMQAMGRADAPARYVCMSLCSLVGSETAPIPATTWGFHSVDGSSSTIPAQQHCKSTVTSLCPSHHTHHCIRLCTMSVDEVLSPPRGPPSLWYKLLCVRM